MDVLDLLLSNPSALLHRDTSTNSDIVFVRDVQIQARIGADAWGRDKSQPVIVSAKLPFSIAQAGTSDDIGHTLDYRTVYKAIRAFDAGDAQKVQQHDALVRLTEAIAKSLGLGHGGRLILHAPKAFLHSDGVIIDLHASDSSSSLVAGVGVKNLHVPCIIGIGEHERLQKQPVIVDFAVPADESLRGEPLPTLLEGLFKTYEASTFLTLEAFVTAFAKHLVVDLGFSKAAVSAHKPSVFSMAGGPGVQILRTREFFQTERS